MLSERVKSWEKNWMQQGMERGLERGLEQGLEQGLERGIQVGERGLLLKQLTRRFGPPDSSVLQRVEQADSTELERWAENILDAQTLEQVFR